ncbi:rRNA maturation RNase YbeY [Candidatus Izimaplasma bacterium ZiA1]|uniref:rRNA maturation RNase YbeY n=1 Tax=Candidatus Izimoplasma sp. ZiA1 TaxID=2024899 RepID=UPI000BAA3A06|nr:rRNA maturation RNase YbeY [Candidatus Izimaplasma bacterium ZiA1]
MKIHLINNYDNKNYDLIIKPVIDLASQIHSVQNDFEINIVLVDNQTIKKYNKEFRNKDYATDVLTFPNGEFKNLGDLIISIDKVEEQSIEYNHSFNRELSFLVVHGFLHSIGYDHQTKEEENEMIELQNEVLNKLKINR